MSFKIAITISLSINQLISAIEIKNQTGNGKNVLDATHVCQVNYPLTYTVAKTGRVLLTSTDVLLLGT